MSLKQLDTLRVVVNRYCTAPIADVVSMLAIIEIFDVGPSRFQSHLQTTVNNFLCMHREGRLGSG